MNKPVVSIFLALMIVVSNARMASANRNAATATVSIDVSKVNLTEANNATAELNQTTADRVDLRRNQGVIYKAPMIQIWCMHHCSDGAMNSADAKVKQIQSLVVECQRDVMSVGEMNHKVRKIVDSIDNMRLKVVSKSVAKMNRRVNRQNIAGFCVDELDLSRTPTL